MCIRDRYGNVLARIGQGRVMAPAAAVELAKATQEIAALWAEAGQRRTQQYKAQAGVLGIGPEFEDYLSSFPPIGSTVKPAVVGVREVK